jgi:hypothetical protein
VFAQVHVCLPCFGCMLGGEDGKGAVHAGSGLAHIGPFADNIIGRPKDYAPVSY